MTKWLLDLRNLATRLAASISQAMALAVAETERMNRKAGLFGDGRGGRRIDAAAQQDDGRCARHRL